MQTDHTTYGHNIEDVALFHSNDRHIFRHLFALFCFSVGATSLRLFYFIIFARCRLTICTDNPGKARHNIKERPIVLDSYGVLHSLFCVGQRIEHNLH